MISASDIRNYGAEIGFDAVGITGAKPFPEYIKIVKNRIKEGLISAESHNEEDIFRRVEFYSNPQNSLSRARSVVSLGMCYLVEGEADRTSPGMPCGRIGRHCWRDFYSELWRKRGILIDFLERKGIHCSKEAYLPHKMVAQKCGVGSYGKNCLIHTERHGSWVMFTSIVTDASFEVDSPSPSDCGSCERCVRACPTGALVADYTLDTGRCINHLLASCLPIPDELRPLLGNSINSCDRCQEVCPANRDVVPLRREFPNPREKWTTSPALLPSPEISDVEFKEAFADLDFYKPELEYLQRNAIVALRNVGDPVALPLLRKMLAHRERMIRIHAAWAVGRIDGPDSEQVLMDALREEREPDVKEEIERVRGNA